MSQLTSYLAKLIGLYCILVALAMVTHKQGTMDTITTIVQNPTAMFVYGLIALITGLAIVLGHNVWSGGALPIIVTLVGWGTLAKGLLALFLSPAQQPVFFLLELHYAKLFYFYAAFAFVLGVYLTYAGTASTTRRTS
jgi:putative exporter of polyketide antibiotics